MYYSTATGYIIILSPLILLALLATIGIVLYRHPSKLQRKWYSVSFKKRKRIKQIAILLGFCMAAGLFIYPLTSKKQFVSTISLSANENNFITEDKINQISEVKSRGSGLWFRATTARCSLRPVHKLG